MRPSKIDGAMTVRFAACYGVWLLALPAFGHPMTVTRGTALVTKEAVVLSLEIRAEDLLHTQKLSPNAEGLYAIEEVRRAAEMHGRALCRSIVVRDARGEEVDGRFDSCKVDRDGSDGLSVDDLRRSRVRCTLKFAMRGTNEYLSFQQVRRRADDVLPTSIVLAIRAGDVSLGTVRLTGGGNVEVVRLASAKVGSAAAGSGCDTERFVQSEAQHTVRAIVRVHDAGVRLELFMPVPLLETWIALPRSRRDFFEGEEQIRCQRELARFIAAHNPLSIDGRRVAGRFAGVAFLDVGEYGDDLGRTARRLSAWTSRVRITMEFDSPRQPRSVELKWTLFNASVLAAHALIVVDDDCQERDLSTYDPHLKWTVD